MAYILDGVVILIFLLAIWLGYRRGFVKTILQLVGCFAAGLIAFALSTPLATSLFDIFMADKAQQMVSKQITETGASSVETALNNILADLPGPVSNLIASNGYTPEKITGELSGSLNGSTDMLAEKIVDMVIKPVAVSLLRTLCFSIIFIVLMILVAIAASMINRVFRLPLLKQVNGTLGAVLGAVQGVLYVFIAVTVISLIAASSKSGSSINQDVVEHTVIVHAVDSVNPVTNALHSLFK